MRARPSVRKKDVIKRERETGGGGGAGGRVLGYTRASSPMCVGVGVGVGVSVDVFVCAHVGAELGVRSARSIHDARGLQGEALHRHPARLCLCLPRQTGKGIFFKKNKFKKKRH